MRFFDLQNFLKGEKIHGILEPLHEKIAEPLFLLYFQHLQWGGDSRGSSGVHWAQEKESTGRERKSPQTCLP